MSIGTDAAATQLFDLFSVPAQDVFSWSGMIVVNATEIIQGLQGTAAALTVVISGFEVT